MPDQSKIFNQLLGELSDLADRLASICERYGEQWAETLPEEPAAPSNNP